MTPKKLRAMQSLARQISTPIEHADALASAVDGDLPPTETCLAPGELRSVLRAAYALACLVLDRPMPGQRRERG